MVEFKQKRKNEIGSDSWRCFNEQSTNLFPTSHLKCFISIHRIYRTVFAEENTKCVGNKWRSITIPSLAIIVTMNQMNEPKIYTDREKKTAIIDLMKKSLDVKKRKYATWRICDIICYSGWMLYEASLSEYLCIAVWREQQRTVIWEW